MTESALPHNGESRRPICYVNFEANAARVSDWYGQKLSVFYSGHDRLSMRAVDFDIIADLEQDQLILSTRQEHPKHTEGY